MPLCPRVLVNLIVIAALLRLVAEKVDGRVIYASGQVLLVLDVLKTVRLVPAFREDVEGYLSADREATILSAWSWSLLRQCGKLT